MLHGFLNTSDANDTSVHIVYEQAPAKFHVSISSHLTVPCLRDVCTMNQFLWQDDLVSVAKFIHACLDKMLCNWLIQ